RTGSSLVRNRNRYAKCVLIRVPRRNARRSAPFGAHKLTPVSVRTSRISAAGRPTASPRAQPVRRSATGFRESTVASRSTMTNAWGNCSKAWSESVRSLAMSPQYRRAYAGLQLLQPALEPQASGTEHVLVQAHVANGLSAEPRLEPVEPEPGMIRSRLLRDAPPVIGVAAECPKIEHRLPAQQLVGHQLALALGQVQVVARLRFEAGFQRLRVEVDIQELGGQRLHGLPLDKRAALEEGRPLIPHPGVGFNPDDDAAPGPRPPLERVEHLHAGGFGDGRSAGNVVDGAAGE